MKLKRQIMRMIKNRGAKGASCRYIPSQDYADDGVLKIHQSRKDITSHDGEDGILEYLIQTLGLKEKTCLEVGAWDGKHLSNTWNLIENHGWTGVLIEADGRKFKELPGSYTNPDKNLYLNEFIGIDNNTLDDLLGEHFKKPIDIMIIDIDGDDWYVFETLEQYLPKVLVIEYNGSIPHDLYFVQDRHSPSPAGASLSAVIELGKKKGYEAVFVTKANVFLVKKELFPLLGIQDNTANTIKPHLQYQTILFQGYDGTIYSFGKKKKVWEHEQIKQGTWVYLTDNS